MKILTYPNVFLKLKAEPVKKINDEILDIVNKMTKIVEMYNGVGLAAPQIGINKRIIVVNMGKLKVAYINPVITHRHGEVYSMEGCLSLPNEQYKVSRNMIIDFKAKTIKGGYKKFETHSRLSMILQHEIDHLDGILINSKGE